MWRCGNYIAEKSSDCLYQDDRCCWYCDIRYTCQAKSKCSFSCFDDSGNEDGVNAYWRDETDNSNGGLSNMKKSRQLAIDIIELFENVLEQHNIIIPDDDRPEDNDTPLYGMTYANLEDEIVYAIESALRPYIEELKEITVNLLDTVSHISSNFEKEKG